MPFVFLICFTQPVFREWNVPVPIPVALFFIDQFPCVSYILYTIFGIDPDDLS